MWHYLPMEYQRQYWNRICNSTFYQFCSRIKFACSRSCFTSETKAKLLYRYSFAQLVGQSVLPFNETFALPIPHLPLSKLSEFSLLSLYMTSQRTEGKQRIRSGSGSILFSLNVEWCEGIFVPLRSALHWVFLNYDCFHCTWGFWQPQKWRSLWSYFKPLLSDTQWQCESAYSLPYIQLMIFMGIFNEFL